MQNLHDAVPPIFADGPSVEDEEGLRRWFEARAAELPKALLRVPFTVQSGTSDRASLGLPLENGHS